MGRYLLFAGDEYYPAGGWQDYKGRFNSFKEAAQEGDFNAVDRFTKLASQASISPISMVSAVGPTGFSV
jgi:hypothetical protein